MRSMVLLPLASRTRPPPDITIFFKSYMLLVWVLQPMHSGAFKIAARRNKHVHVLVFIAVKFLRIQWFSRLIVAADVRRRTSLACVSTSLRRWLQSDWREPADG